MATYLILNVVFLCIVLLVLQLNKALLFSRASLCTLGILLALTATFDTLIISAGIVGYNKQKILGVLIGAAPVEDFFYAALATVLVPSVWHIAKRRNKSATT